MRVRVRVRVRARARARASARTLRMYRTDYSKFFE